MEELLKDEQSKEILKEFIKDYIKENLRLDMTTYQNGTVEIDAYIADEHFQTIG